MDSTYSLLCELTGALVLGVTEKFDDTTLVWGKAAISISQMYIYREFRCCALHSNLVRFEFVLQHLSANVPRNLLDDLTNESSSLAQVTLGAGNSWLDNSSLGFLYSQNYTISPSSVHRFQVA